MSMQDETKPTASSIPSSVIERPMAVRALSLVVALEALVMVGVTGLLIYDVCTQPALSRASSIALLVMAALAAIALTALSVGAWRMQPWVRGPVTVWQVLQVAAAVVIFQGDIAAWVGWLLSACSLVGLLLSFSPQVALVLQRDRETEH